VANAKVLSTGDAPPEGIVVGTVRRIPPSESRPDAIAFFKTTESKRATAPDVLAT